MSDHNNENAVATPDDTRPQTYWPRLGGQSSSGQSVFESVLAIPTITIALYGLFRAMSADIRSEKTASDLFSLQGSSLEELKTQTEEAQRQTSVLSQQLADQRTLTTNTGVQFANVVARLTSQVTYLAEQAEALSALVKEASKKDLFAVRPFGWWRDGSITLDDPDLRQVAHATVQSAGMTWSAKESAIAFLSDNGFPVTGLLASNANINTTAFHNEQMRNAISANSKLEHVLFSPSAAATSGKIILSGSDFSGSFIGNSKFLNSDLSYSKFHNNQQLTVEFDASILYSGSFKDAMMVDTWFKNSALLEAGFSGATLLQRISYLMSGRSYVFLDMCVLE